LNSGTELIEKCNSRCRKNIYEEKVKETNGDSVEFILKRFFLYKNKNEILFDNNKKDYSELKNLIKIEADKFINHNSIENVKKRIDDLKKKLFDEETSLLNLYRQKN